MIYEAMPYIFCIALQIMPLLQNLEKYGLPGSDLIKITFVYIFGMYVYFFCLVLVSIVVVFLKET